MTLPSYVHFPGPLLQYLGEQQGPVRPRVVYDALAQRLGLSEQDRTARLPSGGQSVLQNRVGWAQDALKRAGLSSAPVRGSWLITDAGRKFLEKHGGRVSDQEMARIGSVSRDVSLRALAGGASPEKSPEHDVAGEVPPGETRSPREQIEDALAQIRGSVAQDILENIAKHTPDEFEDLVLDVLHALGYGMSRKDLQRVGRSGDGGIDGIVPLDRLGLQKVYVQAKKWQGQVGAPQIQGFMGALQLQGADKGVLITSGTISGPARDAARQARGSVVLIDGARLAELMIEHGVGVTNDSLRIPKVDTDYFEGG
jgi:restriction system protein